MSGQYEMLRYPQPWNPSHFHTNLGLSREIASSKSQRSYSGTLTGPTELSSAGEYITSPSSQSSGYMMDAHQPEDDHDLLQRLSDQYEAAGEGPLVGARQISSTITKEYANADPIYVQKTLALPHTYSYYRTVRGDGNCGWRAIAFTYFETLLRMGDKNQIRTELARFKSLNNLIKNSGVDWDLLEDFIDHTLNLLVRLQQCVDQPDDGEELLRTFNDEESCSGIITHFRLLTAAWMRRHADLYQNFLVTHPSINEYCASQIDPFKVEIEHLGIKALYDVVVKPAGFAMEISMLDRTPGSQINVHRLEDENVAPNLQFNVPTMRLLYRPDHYDILYKPEDLAHLYQPPQPQQSLSHLQSPTVAIASQYEQYFQNEAPHASWLIDVLPSFSYSQSAYLPPQQPPPHSMPENTFVATPISPTAPTPFVPFPNSTPLSPSAGDAENTVRFRPSKLEFGEGSSAQSIPLQTAMFRNSHYNPAHFRNSEFQPEIWSPESEYVTPSNTKIKDEHHHHYGRQRSH